jgi:non-heme chloroperoxidase
VLPSAATGKRTDEFVRGSRLVVIEGGPHGLTWPHAEAVDRDLLDFLGQRSSAAQKVVALGSAVTKRKV